MTVAEQSEQSPRIIKTPIWHYAQAAVDLKKRGNPNPTPHDICQFVKAKHGFGTLGMEFEISACLPLIKKKIEELFREVVKGVVLVTDQWYSYLRGGTAFDVKDPGKYVACGRYRKAVGLHFATDLNDPVYVQSLKRDTNGMIGKIAAVNERIERARDNNLIDGTNTLGVTNQVTWLGPRRFIQTSVVDVPERTSGPQNQNPVPTDNEEDEIIIEPIEEADCESGQPEQSA